MKVHTGRLARVVARKSGMSWTDSLKKARQIKATHSDDFIVELFGREVK